MLNLVTKIGITRKTTAFNPRNYKISGKYTHKKERATYREVNCPLYKSIDKTYF